MVFVIIITRLVSNFKVIQGEYRFSFLQSARTLCTKNN